MLCARYLLPRTTCFSKPYGRLIQDIQILRTHTRDLSPLYRTVEKDVVGLGIIFIVHVIISYRFIRFP